MIPIAGMLVDAGMSLLGSLIDVGEEKAKEFIEEKTGVKLKSKMTSEELEKLKEFETKNQELLLKKREMYLQDRANARNMQVEALRQSDKFSKRFIYYFAIFWSLVASGYVFGITFLDIPVKNVRFADTTLGFMLGTVISVILGFFYGSSETGGNNA